MTSRRDTQSPHSFAIDTCSLVLASPVLVSRAELANVVDVAHSRGAFARHIAKSTHSMRATQTLSDGASGAITTRKNRVRPRRPVPRASIGSPRSGKPSAASARRQVAEFICSQSESEGVAVSDCDSIRPAMPVRSTAYPVTKVAGSAARYPKGYSMQSRQKLQRLGTVTGRMCLVSGGWF